MQLSRALNSKLFSGRDTFVEFHISRRARKHFGFDESLFMLSGDLIIPNIRAAQNLAAEINRANAGISGKVPSLISPGDLNAMGLYHEVLHYIINSYISEVNPGAFTKFGRWLQRSFDTAEIEKCVRTFVDKFPPTAVYRGDETSEHYLQQSSGGLSNRDVVLIESILLWLENQNPAFAPISQLIDDAELKKESKYHDIIMDSDGFFDGQPKFSDVELPLLKMLRAPMEAHPDSLADQLKFMAKHWEKILVRSPYLLRLLTAFDILKEEGKYFLMLAQARADKGKIPDVRQSEYFGFGEKESQSVLQFRGQEFESENFSSDLGWMPKLVLIAKSTFVWLDQLRKKYQRAITRLDQIPDEELDILARRGFTGLWLIGIWERSHASKRIKHLNGNIDAVASAYSLNSYEISPELGGDNAYLNLKDRAMSRGIRLASDMVPNHMGIDSTWVINHPDWFLGCDYPPFPNYTFNGPDISNDDRVGIFIEDGYWTKRDAAVVFKRYDRWTGSVKYIYHGNDGTHMPWNDTAQLDFTEPEVREAVIQAILHVARKFSIIRFDAAMVLAKKHIQRLWFPEPGTGGAIPSRANFSMSREQFDCLIPSEFWREVVDRIQQEVPDTLLLAEAFWLMEGYFVRTLGMHRVYNSAFMNMLKREENANYRQVVKNVLEYNPQILKRFVNFVNNPDEETAIAQFGKDDKYFGVCVMMATMPGLPMFGHGQIEGFTEKYGMEYKRAYRDEQPDENFVERHEREIFPLLKKRQLFSEMDNFLMYDLYTGDGTVNEDVFAYSNRLGEERTLVVFNNRYSNALGWIKNSVGFRAENGRIVQRQLQDGLALKGGRNEYLIFEDVISHLEYIRPVKSLKKEGLYIELGAFKYNVFMNFHEVYVSHDRPYDEFCDALNGKGVHSLEIALQDYRLRNVHAAFYEAINAGSLNYLLAAVGKEKIKHEKEKVFSEKVEKLVSAVFDYEHLHLKKGNSPDEVENRFGALLLLPDVLEKSKSEKLKAKVPLPSEESGLQGLRVLILWIFLDEVRRSCVKEKIVVHPFDRWRLVPHIVHSFNELDVEEKVSRYESRLVQEILENVGDENNLNLSEIVVEAAKRESSREFLGVNFYGGVTWFNKERFEDFVEYTALVILVKKLARKSGTDLEEIYPILKSKMDEVSKIEKLAEQLNYRLDDFLKELAFI